MNDEINNMKDLLDDDIHKSLSKLGFLFPKSVDDFNKLEFEIKKNPIAQPDRLKDPFHFLGQRSYYIAGQKIETEEFDYPQNLAQAAREGKDIPEDIKRKMAEDKAISKRNKTD